LAIHCQVITSQVMAYRPDRDRSVIARGAPPGVMAGHRWRQKVIITTLLVNGRYFGRVTVSARREPARAGHEPVQRQAEARQGGNDRGPSDGFCTRRLALSHADDLLAGGRRGGAAIVVKRSSAGHLIGAAAYFTALPARRRPLKSRGYCVRRYSPADAIMRAFCRIAARDGRPWRAGRSPWPRRLRLAPAGWGHWADPWWAGGGGSGYSRDQPGLLPRAALHTGICPGQSDARDVFA
jgi:hypothetical protein